MPLQSLQLARSLCDGLWWLSALIDSSAAGAARPAAPAGISALLATHQGDGLRLLAAAVRGPGPALASLHLRLADEWVLDSFRAGENGAGPSQLQTDAVRAEVLMTEALPAFLASTPGAGDADPRAAAKLHEALSALAAECEAGRVPVGSQLRFSRVMTPRGEVKCRLVPGAGPVDASVPEATARLLSAVREFLQRWCGFDEAAELRERAAELEAERAERQKGFDQLLAQLLEAEEHLRVESAAERDAADRWDDELSVVEERRAKQDCMLSSLRIEAEDAARRLADAAQRERRLRTRVREGQAASRRAEQGLAVEEVLSGASEDCPALYKEITAREFVLREMEDRRLNVDELIEEQLRELGRLRQAHDDGAAEEAPLAGVQAELRRSERLARTLGYSLSERLEMLGAAEKRRSALREQVRELTDQEVGQLRQAEELRRELQAAEQLRDAAERQHSGYRALLSQGELQAKAMESVTLLKAVTICLATDVAFVGSVSERFAGAADPPPATRGPFPPPPAPPPALAGMVDAFYALRQAVVDIHGPQRDGERWLLRRPGQLPADTEVEFLLSMVKQMVVCFDILGSIQRVPQAVALEIARNGSNMLSLTTELQRRHSELLERERSEMCLRQVEGPKKRVVAARRQAAATAARARDAAASPSQAPVLT
eukprot:TRINITY_DN2232_c3_g1_i1.p1 TRINITY_DN2232_c3_g1~~TRINITY_DN2232_c3_g1_i1.p1  ORF type:complete len:681 (+),score=274.46 TRINITY_DN2232_c3_g1_i1:57-2045(+)